MYRCRQSWIGIVAASLVAACLGCQPEETPSEPGQSSGQPGNKGATQGKPTEKSPTPKKPPIEKPAPQPTMPKVVMSEADRKTCRRWVGEVFPGLGKVMPDAELPDPSGIPQPLAALRGKKLTVVCFWRSGESRRGELAAIQTLQDLERDFFVPYQKKGVQVIGINVRDEPELAGKRIDEAAVTFPNLIDRDGAFFAEVATERLPRVYLLDAEGRILYLDLEFSPTTRRRLETGIQVELGEI